MEMYNMNESCKSVVFKSILIDIMYSFRSSIKKMTSANTDIRLGRIRFSPIESKGVKVVGRIKNLVGGKITCLIDENLIKFLETKSEPLELFVLDFFDTFSSISKNGIIKLSDQIELIESWVDGIYYISFDIKIFDGSEVIISNLVISIDEITSMYFR